ncbi:TIGR02757 family protein [Bdellovibrionota bacterium FG-2]
MLPISTPKLEEFLRENENRFHRSEFLSSDPLEFVHHYKSPWDQEPVALIAALLAYGNVVQIRHSIRDVLGRIERIAITPSQFVRSLSHEAGLQAAAKCFEGFVHRFNRGPEVLALFKTLNLIWTEHGSLGARFVRDLSPHSAVHSVEDVSTFESALNSLISEIRAREPALAKSHFLTAPQDGSCCKRWCMLLRWMGRRDGIDLGLWTQGSELVRNKGFLSAAQLVIPLDVHVGRISRNLRLTQRKTLDWKAALEVTAALRKVDPTDPVRFDFSLARIGIVDKNSKQKVLDC